jgi:hypothetical protein
MRDTALCFYSGRTGALKFFFKHHCLFHLSRPNSTCIRPGSWCEKSALFFYLLGWVKFVGVSVGRRAGDATVGQRTSHGRGAAS